MANQERGGRLAVRAGDAEHVQRCRGVAVERGGGGGHRRANRRHDDLGHAEAELALHDQRDRATGDRLGGEGVAVAGVAGHAEEERPGLDPPVVVGER
jgi:hypothetical protein